MRNAIEYALVLCKRKEFGPVDLPEDLRSTQNAAATVKVPMSVTQEPQVLTANTGCVRIKRIGSGAEAEAIHEAFTHHHWRMTTVEHELKIGRSTHSQRMGNKATGVNVVI